MKRRIPKLNYKNSKAIVSKQNGSKGELIRRVTAHLRSLLAREATLDARTTRCRSNSTKGKGGIGVLQKPVQFDRRSVSPAQPRTKRSSDTSRFDALVLAAGVAFGVIGDSFAGDGTIDIDVGFTSGTAKPIPVSISGFTGEAAQVIQFDLYVQGFTFTTPQEAQFAITGSNVGNVQGRVVDQINKQTKLSRSYTGAALRKQAHAFADDVVRAITGREGIGQTKIAFKADSGGNGEIYVADFDGYNAQAVTRDNTIVAAPAWVAGKMALYYTSYKLGNPDIFYQNLSTGQRKTVARYSGLNTSAAVSPDGSKIAMILSKGGSPDVYVADADGSNLRQLTKTPEDESSPCWSPDGRWICYAGKRNERRALWKVPASGGSAQHISTAGIRNPSEPDWSPDGKWIVFTAQMGDFNICVISSEGGTTAVLATGEDPSWAPNSRTVIFARRSGSRRILSLLDVPTKQTKDISRVSGSNSQPSWAR